MKKALIQKLHASFEDCAHRSDDGVEFWLARELQTLARLRAVAPIRGGDRAGQDLLDQDARFQDYVIVHELLHLRYATHGRVFKALMSAHVPGWQAMEARRMRMA